MSVVFGATTKASIKSLAIGRFDGVHLGHLELFKRLDDDGGVLIIANGQSPCLTPLELRIKLINKPCFILSLSSVQELSGAQFVEFLKSEFSGLERLVVGQDFRFGKDRAWDVKALAQMFANLCVVSEYCISSMPVHSSAIREFLLAGDVKKAASFLGRNYLISGDVISGQGLGRRELVPTLNLNVRDFLLPDSGVYAVFAEFLGRRVEAVCFIGVRSTDGAFSVEVHLLEFDTGFKPKTLNVEFVSRIRGVQKFNSLSQLKAQITKDIQSCRAVFDER